ncbi:MAG: DUF1491 family protein [Alphaproteobacteria bacterium]|nr:DUF1491 family protein [Alphaproteobacteria bacterium]MBV9371752.1 DUF1491 family protein [Alphaproteobacteria bacterium]MBV9900708.1 DUF1491 family protein [Alphaproteobacteria bacterium]
MEPRLATSVLVGALVRKAEADGGFAAVLAKGDATAGSILVILLQRGGPPQVLERVLAGTGEYRWESSASPPGAEQAWVPELVARRRRFDPDLWVIELDVPSVERFAAEMNALN